jgi:hypothetical protein
MKNFIRTLTFLLTIFLKTLICEIDNAFKMLSIHRALIKNAIQIILFSIFKKKPVL